MPRAVQNADGVFVKEETRWLELPPRISIIELIHQLQRFQERLPKDFSNDRIQRVTSLDNVIELEDREDAPLNQQFGDRELNLRIAFERPETDQERISREEYERIEAEQKQRERRQEFFRLREEFEGIPIPVEEQDVRVVGINNDRQVQRDPRFLVDQGVVVNRAPTPQEIQDARDNNMDLRYSTIMNRWLRVEREEPEMNEQWEDIDLEHDEEI